MDKNENHVHEFVISSFLKDLNMDSDAFILKGGTSLRLCYGLDRFSEDIDLDAPPGNDLVEFVDQFCKQHSYSYRIAKNTDTVKRCFINYGNEGRPLKIEASYRRKEISEDDCTFINGIHVYKIDRIAQMKSNAYAARDKIRDLYDVVFICKNYFDELSVPTKNLLSDAIANKGLEQFDYLIATQKDLLIDNDKLASDFLEVNNKLGLLYSGEEQESLKKTVYKLTVDENYKMLNDGLAEYIADKKARSLSNNHNNKRM